MKSGCWTEPDTFRSGRMGYTYYFQEILTEFYTFFSMSRKWLQKLLIGTIFYNDNDNNYVSVSI